MQIEMDKESAVELENLARYICCILPKDGMDTIKKVRSGRKSLCEALGIEYNIKDEISE